MIFHLYRFKKTYPFILHNQEFRGQIHCPCIACCSPQLGKYEIILFSLHFFRVYITKKLHSVINNIITLYSIMVLTSYFVMVFLIYFVMVFNIFCYVYYYFYVWSVAHYYRPFILPFLI
jgi:hypothetical protein